MFVVFGFCFWFIVTEAFVSYLDIVFATPVTLFIELILNNKGCFTMYHESMMSVKIQLYLCTIFGNVILCLTSGDM